MKKIKIITDSTADLNTDIIENNAISVMPLYVTFDEDVYRDGIDIDTEKLYDLVSEKGTLPKTSAISPGDFINEFDKWIKQGYDILYIGIGSKISGTFQSANVAKQEFPNSNIQLVDSLNLSSGIALLVLKAIDLRNQGFDVLTIKSILDDTVPRVRSQFAIKVLDYLHKGGRASQTQALVGGLLRIRPIIKVVNGELIVYKKPLGKMTKAIDIMLEDFFSIKDKVDNNYIMVTHTMASKHANYMIEKVKNNFNAKQVIESNAGCVISSHCGAGTIGILYIENA